MKLTMASGFTSRFWLLPNYKYPNWVPSANPDKEQTVQSQLSFHFSYAGSRWILRRRCLPPSRVFLFRALRSPLQFSWRGGRLAQEGRGSWLPGVSGSAEERRFGAWPSFSRTSCDGGGFAARTWHLGAAACGTLGGRLHQPRREFPHRPREGLREAQ